MLSLAGRAALCRFAKRKHARVSRLRGFCLHGSLSLSGFIPSHPGRQFIHFSIILLISSVVVGGKNIYFFMNSIKIIIRFFFNGWYVLGYGTIIIHVFTLYVNYSFHYILDTRLKNLINFKWSAILINAFFFLLISAKHKKFRKYMTFIYCVNVSMLLKKDPMPTHLIKLQYYGQLINTVTVNIAV